MLKIKVPGVHKVTAKGKTYYYAWRGGPRINAQPDTRAFMAEYIKLTRARSDGPLTGCMAELIRSYTKSMHWRELRPSTKSSYLRALGKIELEFGDFPVHRIGEKGVRRMFLDWRDEIAEEYPRAADITMSVLQALMSFALDRELIDRHPLERIGKVSDTSRRDVIWTDEQIDLFRREAPEHLVRALMLALWTGQRQGDLLRLTWTAYDGDSISLKQEKTGAHVRVAVSQELRGILAGIPRTAVTILTTEDGNPWGGGFKNSFIAMKKRLGIDGVTFHDLRGTFVTLAYRRGASIREIAEVTGHKERDAEGIIRKHYLVSSAAIHKLERKTSGNG